MSSPEPVTPAPYTLRSGVTTPDNCDREPVHVPGCIQPEGVLLSVCPETLQIRQVSANTLAWLGRDPESLIGHPLDTLCNSREVAAVRAALEGGRLEANPLYLFTLGGGQGGDALDVTGHTHGGRLLLEFEPTGHTEPGAPDHYQLLKGVVARLQGAPSLRAFCQLAAEEVRALTGLDRVMVYQFLEDGAGKVIAEAKREDLEPFLDLHYPPEDIPQPAREIFRRIWVRPLPDAAGEPVEMVPLADPVSGQPLDMTYCALRGASVMYTEYLLNMGVAMSLTLSLIREGRLWGLIACHHYAPRRVRFPVRAACEFLAQVVSLQLAAAQDRDFAEYRLRLQEAQERLLERVAPEDAPLSALLRNEADLLALVSASGVMLCRGAEHLTAGETPLAALREPLLTWLRDTLAARAPGDELVHTDHLSAVLPEAAEHAATASGVLALPLARTGRDWLIWFRPEVVQTVKWGGNPYEKVIKYGPHGPRLHPRASFALWRESVRGRSLPWLDVEIEAARRFRRSLLEVVLRHSERLEELNRELAASNAELDSFAYIASHDLKEPLRGIYHYATTLEEALGPAITEEARLRTSSLMRLTRRMDNLLDSLLHYSRVGRLDLGVGETDLNEVLEEVLDMLHPSLRQAGIEIRIPAPLPTVECDYVRVRELFLNLVGNALKYNDKPQRWIEIGSRPGPEGTPPKIYVRDNGIGVPEQHRERIFQMFKRLHGRNEFGGGTGSGLAIVRKIVERHGGRIWVESVVGEGSTFVFTLAPPEEA